MTVRPHRRLARRGISLLEVLLAMSVFLIALTGIAALVDIGSDRALETYLQNTGTRLAQSKMAEVEAGAISVLDGGTGSCDDEPGWQWAVEPGTAEVPNVYPVTVRVWKEVRGVRHEVALHQMVFDPAQMGTSAEAQPPMTTGSASGSGTGSSTTGGM